MDSDLNRDLENSAPAMQEAIEISQSLTNLESNNGGVNLKNKNMASINTSIQNKNLNGKDRYNNKSNMNITSESMIQSKSNLGLM